MWTAEMTEKTGTTRQHSWERSPREEWKPIVKDGPRKQQFQDWLEVFFHCAYCDCVGHSAWKDGPYPERPEEARNIHTRELVDPLGDCVEQMVETVHAQ